MNRVQKMLKGMNGLLAVAFILMSAVPAWSLSGGQGAERTVALANLTAPDGGRLFRQLFPNQEKGLEVDYARLAPAIADRVKVIALDEAIATTSPETFLELMDYVAAKSKTAEGYNPKTDPVRIGLLRFDNRSDVPDRLSLEEWAATISSFLSKATGRTITIDPTIFAAVIDDAKTLENADRVNEVFQGSVGAPFDTYIGRDAFAIAQNVVALVFNVALEPNQVIRGLFNEAVQGALGDGRKFIDPIQVDDNDTLDALAEFREAMA